MSQVETIFPSKKVKAFALIVATSALFVFGAGSTDNLALRALWGAPLFLLTFSVLFLRKPRFIDEYFKEVVNRDASRGLISIKNLGLAIILIGASFLYLATQ